MGVRGFGCGYELRSNCGLDHSREDDALRAIRLFTTKMRIPLLEGTTPTSSRSGGTEIAEYQALVDASIRRYDRYEQYENRKAISWRDVWKLPWSPLRLRSTVPPRRRKALDNWSGGNFVGPPRAARAGRHR